MKIEILMRRSILFLITSFFIVTLEAQIDVKYTATVEQGTANDFEIIAHNTVYNNSSTTDTLIWVRTKAEIPEGWFTAGCDNVACHFPETDSNEFYIAPGDSSNLDIYFVPEGFAGEGDVELLLYRKSEGRSKGLVLKYSANAVTTSIDELISSGELDIYPLPASDILNVSSLSSQISSISIHDLSGSLIINSTKSPIDISSLSTGVYIVQFEKGGEVLNYRFVKE